MLTMTGYRDDYNVSAATDHDNATCQSVTEPESENVFVLRAQLPPADYEPTVTLVMSGDGCMEFPATMVYTEGNSSAQLTSQNNPSFCERVPGRCEFQCKCKAVHCPNVFVVILSSRTVIRELCEIYIA